MAAMQRPRPAWTTCCRAKALRHANDRYRLPPVPSPSAFYAPPLTPIIHAADGLAARAAYNAFVKKWSPLCPAVARSLEEGGLELLTFYDFPKSMWKALRTTNTLENLHREFRRRTKTQASFSTEDAALTLLYGLVAFGQIALRRIDGHHALSTVTGKLWSQAA